MLAKISVKKYVKAYILRVYGTEIRANGNCQLSQEIEFLIAAAIATTTLNTETTQSDCICVELTPRLSKLYRRHEQHFINFDIFFLAGFDHALYNFIIGQYIIFGEIHKAILAFYELYNISENDLSIDAAYKRFQRFCAANTAAQLLWQDVNKAYKHNNAKIAQRVNDRKKTGSYLLLQ